MFIVNDPSLNGGRKLRPSEKNIASATATPPPVTPRTTRLCSNAHCKARPYHRFSHFESATSRASRPPSSRLHNTGVRVSATKVEAANAAINAIPRGTSILPSIPERKKSGTKLAMIMSVELRIGILTSRDASYTTSITGLRPRFSRRRL